MEFLAWWPFVAAYLLGSLPFGLLLPLIFKGQDVRTAGSGNIGSTNVIRTAGKKIGAAVQALDILKGVAGAALCRHFLAGKLGPLPDDAIAGFGTVAAVIGHCYPVWLKFNGGKGVNAALGGSLVAGWVPALLSLALFFPLFFRTRMVSLAAMIAVCSFPLWAAVVAFFLGPAWSSYELALSGLPFVFIILWRHRGNIARLRAGTELKM